MKVEIYKEISADAVPQPGHKYTTYTFGSLKIDERVIAKGSQQGFEFVELLNSFVTNQLISKKLYEFGTNEEGYMAKVVSQKGNKYLMIDTKKQKYYYEKLECKIIVKMLNKTLLRCMLPEFV